MNKNKKIGFFKKILLVISDFRIYPYLVKHESLFKSFTYLLGLILIFSLVISLNVFLKLDELVNGIIQDYDTLVPEFELSSGKLNVSENIYEKIGNRGFLIVDTNHIYDEIKSTKEYEKSLIFDFSAIVSREDITIDLNGNPQYRVNFKDSNYDLNNESMLDVLIDFSNDIVYRILIFISISISVFMAYLIITLSKVLFVAVIILIIGLLFGIYLNFANYIKLSIYIHTLPLLIEFISIYFIGTIKDYAYYTYLILTYVYAIYAIRAIKLDAFLIMFSSKKNIKRTSSEFDRELKKHNEIANNEEGLRFEDENDDQDNKNMEDESEK